jgi:hypothetical protein
MSHLLEAFDKLVRLCQMSLKPERSSPELALLASFGRAFIKRFSTSCGPRSSPTNNSRSEGPFTGHLFSSALGTLIATRLFHRRVKGRATILTTLNISNRAKRFGLVSLFYRRDISHRPVLLNGEQAFKGRAMPPASAAGTALMTNPSLLDRSFIVLSSRFAYSRARQVSPQTKFDSE